MERGKGISGFAGSLEVTGAGMGPGLRGGFGAPPGVEARPPDSTTVLFGHSDFMLDSLNGKGGPGLRQVSCIFEQNNFV